jgi:chaperonin cofactor prefoldin
MDKLYQAEPEIREDLQGRIEVFDQSIRSFEKRLRAVERRLSLETPASMQNGRNFPGSFQEENTVNAALGSSVYPQTSSVSPESSVPENSFLSNSVTSLSEGNTSGFALSSVLSTGGTSNLSMLAVDNSSEVSGTGYKIKTINEVFSSFSESIRSLQVAVSELSNFANNNLKPEISKLDLEIQNLKAQENTKNEYIKKLESRIEIIENQNKFTLGSIKIPMEVSGITGASVLFLTGFLVWAGRWDIIRSAYFPIGLAVLMAGIVFMKFYMVNSEKKTLSDKS